MAEPTPPSDLAAGSTRPRTTSRGWRVLRFAVQIALTLVVTIFIVDRLGPGMGELASSAPQEIAFHWGWIVVSSLVLLGGYFFSAWIWSRMVHDLGGPALPVRDSIRVYMVANLGRYIPGKLWQIAGLAVLARSRGVPAPIATAAAVVGQVVALAGTMLVGLVALGTAGPDLARWAPLAIVATAGVALVVTVPMIFRPLLRFCLRFVPGEKPDEIPVGASEGIRWLALYTINWVVYALAFGLFVHGLSLPGSLLDVGPAFAASYVMGYIVLIAPAGVGVREGFMVAFLSPIMGPAGATLAAVTSRIWMTLVEVVPAGAFWLAGVGRGRAGKEKLA